ncbi:NADPH-dependent ferric siderophore reductase [Acinetobacter calcoaceticus]|uniref:NADPH-dependent ferric siderophore reductase n=1 Tax=Acinetobacter calcoaceticus TaxID=471 RepID=A0A4R1Y8F4_ACICA|nr:NADPH-dependent ferric siderophore reductase [Acinetobacter calcoaceticus]
MIIDKQKQQISCIVLSAQMITTHMRRIVLGGPELSAWLANSAVQAAAAWVKVFPPGVKGRAYTLREIDDEKSTMSIDFVMHGEDAKTDTVSGWARHCVPGDCVNIAGPRSGGFELDPSTEWLWIAADLTALPAAIRIIESLPAHINVCGFFVVDALTDKQEIHTPAKFKARWRTLAIRPEMNANRNYIIKDIQALHGNGQVWIAGEARWVKSWRAFWMDSKNLAANKISSKGYWKLGENDYRD